jgi:hypothetical protein
MQYRACQSSLNDVSIVNSCFRTMEVMGLAHIDASVLIRWDGSDRCNCDENGEKMHFRVCCCVVTRSCAFSSVISSCFAIAYDGDGGGGMH